MTSDKSQGLILSVLAWEEYSSEAAICETLPELTPEEIHDLLILLQNRKMVHKREGKDEYKKRPIF